MKRQQFVLLLFVAMTILTVNFDGLLASDEDVFHGGNIIYTVPVKAVLFSHKNHVEDVGLSCEACHDEIFQMESLAAQENKDFTMQALYEGKYCGACHDGTMAFASNSQCARCHIGVKGYKMLQGKERSDE